MNNCSFIGRLTKDPEVKKTQNGTSVCSFTIAVDRRFKNADGARQTDFIPCVGWRQVADIIGQYFRKGSRIGITGSIQTRSYDGQNGKVFVVEVLAEQIDFIDKRAETQDEESRPIPPMPKAEPIQATELDDEYLPFDLEGFGEDMGELGN